mgnify:CR=1 FL=1
MDGIDFLSRLMRLRPMPVVMVSTLTERGAEVTLRALELGAIDFVAKPRIGVADGLQRLADDITDKIRIAARAQVRRLASATPPGPGGHVSAGRASRRWGACRPRRSIFIGASTGGTEATKAVLMRAAGRLAGDPDHPAHAARLHHQLRQAARLVVPDPRQGGRATASACCPGTPTSRPAGFICRWSAAAPTTWRACATASAVNRHKPSVEVLFESAARVVGPNALAVMLTGMGADGAQAMRADARRRQLQHLPGRSQLRGIRHAARGHRTRRRARGAAAGAHRRGAGGAPEEHCGRHHPPHLKRSASAAPHTAGSVWLPTGHAKLLRATLC